MRNYQINTLVRLYLFAVFFPWVMPFVSLDMKPLAFVLGLPIACYVFLKRGLKVTQTELYLLCLAFLAPIFVLFDPEFSSLTIRALVTYTSFFIHAICLGYISTRVNLAKWIVAASFVYFVASVAQMVFTQEIFSFFVDSRTSQSRGAASLTPEPSSYGLIALFLLGLEVYYYKFNGFKTSLSFWPNLAGLFVLSASMTAIAAALILASIIVFISFRPIKMVYNLLIGALLVLGFTVMFGLPSRLEQLVRLGFESGFYNVILLDESANDRVRSIVFALHGTVKNNFLPGLFHSFEEMSNILFGYWDDLKFGQASNRSMSGIATLIYEYGLFSILFFCALWNSTRRFSLRDRISIISLYGMVFTLSMPMSLPLCGGVLGVIGGWHARRR